MFVCACVAACRSAAGVDVVPTFTTSNARMCLLLSNGRFGLLRIEDAERLQVRAAWQLADYSTAPQTLSQSSRGLPIVEIVHIRKQKSTCSVVKQPQLNNLYN
jgi:hypothetical protein